MGKHVIIMDSPLNVGMILSETKLNIKIDHIYNKMRHRESIVYPSILTKLPPRICPLEDSVILHTQLRDIIACSL